MHDLKDRLSKATRKTEEWVADVKKELGWDNSSKAFRALEACLQALRDRLTVDEAVDIGAQLPTLIRGYYYEGWHPSGKPSKKRGLQSFLAHIGEAFELDDMVGSEDVARAVFKVLAGRVSNGEIEDIKRALPKELRRLWP